MNEQKVRYFEISVDGDFVTESDVELAIQKVIDEVASAGGRVIGITTSASHSLRHSLRATTVLYEVGPVGGSLLHRPDLEPIEKQVPS